MSQSYSHPVISGKKVVWLEHLGLDTTPTGSSDAKNWYNTPFNVCGADVSNWNSPIYFTIKQNAGRRDPYPCFTYYNDFDDVIDISGNIAVWEGDGDICGADISDLNNIKVFTICSAPGRQFDPAISGNIVIWTDRRNDNGDIYGADISDLNHIQEMVIVKKTGTQEQSAIDDDIIVYVDGGTMGYIRTCFVDKNIGVVDVPLSDSLYGCGPSIDAGKIVWQITHYGTIKGISINQIAVSYPTIDGPIENLNSGATFDYINHAISFAQDGDEIVVKSGVYKEKINFLGKNLIVRSTHPDNPHVVAKTIIDSNGLDSSTVTFAGGEDANCVLNGFTITGGTGTLDTTTLPYNRYGGGIYCNNSSPTIINNVIVKNFCPLLSPDRTRGSGGGIYCNNAGPSLRNNVIRNNEADSGGGIYQSSGLIANCAISGNSAYFGGGLFDCSGDIVGCIISNNYAIRNGAAMASCSGDLDNCTITGNIASASGGGLMQYSGSLRNSIFAHNSPYAIYDSPIGYVKTVQNCCFHGNPDGDWFYYGSAGLVGVNGADAINALEDVNGVIDCDPCFVDVNNGDWHLRWSSDCINAGYPNFVCEPNETDIDGEPRMMGTKIDIGADEVGPKQADFTRDGIINYKDFAILADRWMTITYDASWYELCDLIEDGQIDANDLASFASDWLWIGNDTNDTDDDPNNEILLEIYSGGWGRAY